MKHFIILCFLTFLSFSSKAQVLPLDPETKITTFQETISLDSAGKESLSQEDVYNRSIAWLTNYYKTSKFDIDKKVEGKTGHEGNFVVSLTYDFKYKAEHTITYNLLINQKVGKYRYTLTDFQIYNAKTGPKSIQYLEGAFAKMTLANKKELIAQLNKEVKVITDSLKESMKSGEAKAKSEWD